ncbi:MAG TPA: aspartate/glutamate racemase family protein, partial [Burkholderiaceae bacterium]|nr:aspartate/glutamate racemase family protein [Burkholderiaceae bacterium]
RSATSSAQRRWELPTDQEMRTLVMPGIEAVKAGQSDRASALLQEAAHALISRGAGVLVLGCTEIPVALRAARMPVPVVDATASLARRAVAWSLGTARTVARARHSQK